ncbi:MAG: metallophosphoesterase [Ruminococcus sp.]|nr:metallophosphoesterase [Ruminococcus sp.]
MKKKLKTALIIFFAVVLCFVTYIILENNTISLTQYDINSDKVSNGNKLTIVHVSDLHNKEFGKDNKRLLKKIESCNPDIIAVTGDIIDSYHTDVDVAITFMQKASEIAPCYFIPGNHEQRVPDEYNTFKEELEGFNVTILENEAVEFTQKEDTFSLIGLIDPNFVFDYPTGYISTQLSTLSADDNYTVLLSHRPEYFETYTSFDVDLVLSGHAHGGQFRIPFIGGLFAPDQGAFPKYDSGMFSDNNTEMIVSRGLGNSVFPFRLNNPPELITITIE